MITWTESYVFGIARIDEHHKALVDKINELYAAMRGGRGRQSVGPIMEFLKTYARNHFTEEESLMVRYSYPDYEEHKREHDGFRETFAGMYREIEANPQSVRNAVKVERWLSAWIVNHLKQVDKKAMVYLVSKGVR